MFLHTLLEPGLRAISCWMGKPFDSFVVSDKTQEAFGDDDFDCDLLVKNFKELLCAGVKDIVL